MKFLQKVLEVIQKIAWNSLKIIVQTFESCMRLFKKLNEILLKIA